jgi:dephospho-CoA kinase
MKNKLKLIGISGKIGSGKDTIYNIIKETYTLPNGKVWQNMKFAGKLKAVASLLTGIPIEKFEDQEFKKTILGSEWGKPNKQNPLSAIEPFKDITVIEMMSVRDLLQKLGTEAMRNGLHENVWVNALFSDYTKDQYWIITDVRFPNEFKAIKEKGGIVIRVNRPSHSKHIVKVINDHPSETALDGYDFDYVIENDGDLKKLKSKIKSLLEILNNNDTN